MDPTPSTHAVCISAAMGWSGLKLLLFAFLKEKAGANSIKATSRLAGIDGHYLSQALGESDTTPSTWD